MRLSKKTPGCVFFLKKKTPPVFFLRESFSNCYTGIRQKFLENEVPRQLLLNKTKGKRISECTKDSVWGCGMSIHNDDCLDTTKWISQGIMGKLLEEIRSELAGPDSTPLPPLPDFKNKKPTEKQESLAEPHGTTSPISTVQNQKEDTTMETRNSITSSSSLEESSDAE